MKASGHPLADHDSLISLQSMPAAWSLGLPGPTVGANLLSLGSVDAPEALDDAALLESVAASIQRGDNLKFKDDVSPPPAYRVFSLLRWSRVARSFFSLRRVRDLR